MLIVTTNPLSLSILSLSLSRIRLLPRTHKTRTRIDQRSSTRRHTSSALSPRSRFPQTTPSRISPRFAGAVEREIKRT
ncbi:hypothetical protein AAHA92_18163 [Salvia divinorum]|uniref:Uncharacterized protein n=1 Tax=Salvia divinorum TaxID=28513 RepID=A0ABD1H4F9_SALDI